jgi:dephospho-CoA kinase
MIVVGLTGSVGTGKSTVARFFRELGAYVIDWDELAREVVRPNSEAWRQIVEHFGADIVNQDSTLNRQKLADIVFRNKEELAKLNEIVHPQVFIEDERITNQIRNNDPDALVVKDIPLLLEANLPIVVDKIIVVYASRGVQLKRLQENGMSREDAERRIRSQLSLEEKMKFADFVINNDGSLEETRKQVKEIYCALMAGKRCVEWPG